MVERILGGWVGKGTQDSDRIVALNANAESLKEEGALAVIVCALCNAPSKVAQEVHAVLVNRSHRFSRDWKQV